MLLLTCFPFFFCYKSDYALTRDANIPLISVQACTVNLQMFLSILLGNIAAASQDEAYLPRGAVGCAVRFRRFSHLSSLAAVCVPEVLGGGDRNTLSHL